MVISKIERAEMESGKLMVEMKSIWSSMIRMTRRRRKIALIALWTTLLIIMSMLEMVSLEGKEIRLEVILRRLLGGILMMGLMEREVTEMNWSSARTSTVESKISAVILQESKDKLTSSQVEVRMRLRRHPKRKTDKAKTGESPVL